MNGAGAEWTLFYAKARSYDERARGVARRGRTFPTSVYTRLIDGVNRNLPTFHRYLKLRKRMMKRDRAALLRSVRAARRVGRPDLHAEEAQKHVLAARRAARAGVRGGGQARVQRALDRSLSQRRQAVGRVLERRRLRRPPVHADQLQRQVHRRQHAGARARPHDAELLLEQDAAVPARRLSDLRRRGRVDVQRGAAHRPHARRRSRTTTTRLSLLGNYLENIKGTVFRQTQFAEFELRMHEMAEKGRADHRRRARQAVSRTSRKKYYGHDQGVCVVDDYVAHEWSFIPHFYRDFYVFQYATSFTASAALVREGARRATRRRRSAI